MIGEYSLFGFNQTKNWDYSKTVNVQSFWGAVHPDPGPCQDDTWTSQDDRGADLGQAGMNECCEVLG